jgi:hypothetical protein
MPILFIHENCLQVVQQDARNIQDIIIMRRTFIRISLRPCILVHLIAPTVDYVNDKKISDLAFLLLGIIVSMTSFFFILPPGTGSYCPRPSFPPEHGSPGGLHSLFTATKTERNLKSFYFEHYYDEKARIIQSVGGFFLLFPSCVSPLWTTEGLPLNKTADSSLERVAPPILLSFHIASLMVGGPLSGRC